MAIHCSADRPRDGDCAVWASTSEEHETRPVHRPWRLAAHVCRDVQLHGGHDAPVLHRGHGSSDGWTGRHGRGRCMAAPRPPVGSCRERRRYPRVRCDGIRRPSSCVRFIPDVVTVGYSRRHRYRCIGMVRFAVGVRGRGSSARRRICVVEAFRRCPVTPGGRRRCCRSCDARGTECVQCVHHRSRQYRFGRVGRSEI